MEINPENRTGSVRISSSLAAVAGLLGALAASSCCLLPLMLVTIGASGAWIGNLTALAPYQPCILTPTLGALGYGFYLVYRRPPQACADGTCVRPLQGYAVKLGLWVAIILVAAAVIFPRIALMLAT